LRLTEANVAAFKRQLDADASAAFIEVCRTQATLSRKESSLAAMRDIVRANETRFKAGDIGRLELSQSRVEADRFQADVVSARAEANAAELALANFLGERGEERFASRALDTSAENLRTLRRRHRHDRREHSWPSSRGASPGRFRRAGPGQLW
jgi:cobalt-zinc-cadmium efflux system outer membrane protein